MEDWKSELRELIDDVAEAQSDIIYCDSGRTDSCIIAKADAIKKVIDYVDKKVNPRCTCDACMRYLSTPQAREE